MKVLALAGSWIEALRNDEIAWRDQPGPRAFRREVVPPVDIASGDCIASRATRGERGGREGEET